MRVRAYGHSEKAVADEESHCPTVNPRLISKTGNRLTPATKFRASLGMTSGGMVGRIPFPVAMGEG